MKKKLLFEITAAVVTMVPVVSVVACSKVTIGDPSILPNEDITKDIAFNMRGQGSSSTLPIVKSLQEALFRKDFQYEGTGSGDGFKIAMGQISGKDFGMTSSLKKPSTDAEKQYWINNNVRTVTFAIDAIGIALNLPSGLKSALGNNRPVVKAIELAKLYDNDSSNNSVSWSQLLDNPEANGFTDKVQAFGRTGGKSASGTADGFFGGLEKASGLGADKFDVNHDLLSPSLQTAEANAAAKMALENENNGLAYLSLGFALSNESNRLTVATIKTSVGDLWIPKDNITHSITFDKYKWKRPFNILYNAKSERASSFAKMLLKSPVQKEIEFLEFFPLSVQQLAQQQDVTLSDAEIYNNFANPSDWNNLGLGEL